MSEFFNEILGGNGSGGSGGSGGAKLWNPLAMPGEPKYQDIQAGVKKSGTFAIVDNSTQSAIDQIPMRTANSLIKFDDEPNVGWRIISSTALQSKYTTPAIVDDETILNATFPPSEQYSDYYCFVNSTNTYWQCKISGTNFIWDNTGEATIDAISREEVNNLIESNSIFDRNRANHTGTQLASTISDFTESAQDAIGSSLLDTATIDLTYDDATNQISADVKDLSLTNSKIATNADIATSKIKQSVITPILARPQNGNTQEQINNSSLGLIDNLQSQIDTRPIGASNGNIYYLTSQASAIPNYELVSFSPDPSPLDIESIIINSTTAKASRLIHSYIANYEIGSAIINGGNWLFNFYGYVSHLNSSRFEIDILKRDIGGAETLLFTCETTDFLQIAQVSPELNIVNVETTQQDFACNTTDKIVIKVYGKTDRTQNTTITLLHSGTEYASHIHTPIIVSHNNLAGAQGGTATEKYHLSLADYNKVLSLDASLASKVDKVANKSLILDTEITRLATMATNATANQTDAYLLNRSNHTGTQDISTITNLQTNLNAKQNSIIKVANQSAMLALSTAIVGDIVIRTDDNNYQYRLSALPASNLSNWEVLGKDAQPVGETVQDIITTNESLTSKVDGLYAFAGIPSGGLPSGVAQGEIALKTGSSWTIAYTFANAPAAIFSNSDGKTYLKTINGAGVNTWQAKSEPTVYEFGADKQYNTLQSAINAYQADFTSGKTSLGVIFCYQSIINEDVSIGGTTDIQNLHIEGYGCPARSSTQITKLTLGAFSHRITLKNIMPSNTTANAPLVVQSSGTCTENGVANIGRGKHVFDGVSISTPNTTSVDITSCNNFLNLNNCDFGGKIVNIANQTGTATSVTINGCSNGILNIGNNRIVTKNNSASIYRGTISTTGTLILDVDTATPTAYSILRNYSALGASIPIALGSMIVNDDTGGTLQMLKCTTAYTIAGNIGIGTAIDLTKYQVQTDNSKANDSAVVHTTGNETIAGSKTFSTAPNLSSLTASQRLELDASKNVISVAKNTADNQNFETSTSNIKANGVVAVGTSNNIARADHVHPNDTSREATANKDASGGYVGLTLFKINFKNVLNTFTSFFTNSNTAARTYTFQDRDGTIADNTDIDGRQPLNTTLTGLSNLDATNGIIVQTGADTFTKRTLTAGTGISITNGNGVAGNPIFQIADGGVTSEMILDGTITNDHISETANIATSKIQQDTITPVSSSPANSDSQETINNKVTGLINSGSSLITTIENLSSSGVIGTASATVDNYAIAVLNQTTTGLTFTLPTPTNTIIGKTFTVVCNSTANFVIYGITIDINTYATFVWNGSAWRAESTTGGGGISSTKIPLSYPIPETDITISGFGTNISVNWTAQANAAKYKIYHKQSSLGAINTVVDAPSAIISAPINYTTLPVLLNVEYNYAVICESTVDPITNVQNYTSTGIANFTLDTFDGTTGTSALLSWSLFAAATEYKVLYQIGTSLTSPTIISGITGNSTSITGLTTSNQNDVNTAYTFKVEAYNSDGVKIDETLPITRPVFPNINIALFSDTPVSLTTQSISRVGTVATFTTVGSHGLVQGDTITISNAVAPFNVTYGLVRTVETSVTFTYTVADSGSTSTTSATIQKFPNAFRMWNYYKFIQYLTYLETNTAKVFPRMGDIYRNPNNYANDLIFSTSKYSWSGNNQAGWYSLKPYANGVEKPVLMDTNGNTSILMFDGSITYTDRTDKFLFTNDDHRSYRMLHGGNLYLANINTSVINNPVWLRLNKDLSQNNTATNIFPLPNSFSQDKTALVAILLLSGYSVFFDNNDQELKWIYKDGTREFSIPYSTIGMTGVLGFGLQPLPVGWYVMHDNVNKIVVGNRANPNIPSYVITINFNNNTATVASMTRITNTNLTTEENAFGEEVSTYFNLSTNTVIGLYHSGNSGQGIYYALTQNIFSGDPNIYSGLFAVVPGAISQVGLNPVHFIDTTGQIWFADWGHDNEGMFRVYPANDDGLGIVKIPNASISPRLLQYI